MEKVGYRIHHQAIADCPKCGELVVEDLGEDDNAEDMSVRCPRCEHKFELSEEEF